MDSRFWKMYTLFKKFFDTITTPLSVFWISFYRKLKVGDLVNPRQRINKFVPLPNLASHLLICNLDKTTNTYITITWMVQLGFNIRTSLISEICVLVLHSIIFLYFVTLFFFMLKRVFVSFSFFLFSLSLVRVF